MKIKEIEKILGKKIKKKAIVFGVDTASKSGWALLKTDNLNIYKECGTIKVDTTDEYLKYNRIIEIFDNIIKPEYEVIVEETFFRFNPRMFRMISRIGAIVYTIAKLKGCKVQFISAVQARKKIGVSPTLKKFAVHAEFKNKYPFKFKDRDILDGLILALAGLIKE